MKKILSTFPLCALLATCAALSPTDQAQLKSAIISASVGAATAAASSASQQLQSGKKVDQKQVGSAAAVGALQGLSAATSPAPTASGS